MTYLTEREDCSDNRKVVRIRWWDASGLILTRKSLNPADK